MISRLSRSLQEIELLSREIMNGDFGADGDLFVSTQKLADLRGISLVTAQRVMEGLREKNLIELKGKKYFLAYAMELQKTKIFALHIPDIENQYFASIVQAVQSSAAKCGYKLIISCSGYNTRREFEIMQMFQTINAVGVMSCPGVSDNTRAIYHKYQLPLVFIGRIPHKINGQSVSVNVYPATKRVAEHFIANRYKNFAYVGLREFPIEEDQRLQGFHDGIKKAGYKLAEESIIRVRVKDIMKASELFQNFLMAQPKPTAVFCFHDLIAAEIMRACHKLKLAIPEDIAVCGFDNLPIASSLVPTLTTVGYEINEMADMAIRLLCKQVEHGIKKSLNYYIEPSLVIRESSTKHELDENRLASNLENFHNSVIT